LNVADPWKFFSAAQIARASGCPVADVTTNWPIVADALERRDIYNRDVCRGVIGTIAVETASTFRPIHEFGTERDWAHYEGGPAFAGRGYIQITHLSGYRDAGDALGVNLVGNPDLALDPKISADILAWYWATRGVPSKDRTRWWSLPDLCRDQDWEWVRRVVQGGTNGLDRLIAIATALGESTAADAAETTTLASRGTTVSVRFDANFPATIQDDDWSCAPSSLDWALRSLGRTPGHSYIEDTLVADNIVSKEDGLLDGSGKDLAAWIGRKEPADKYYGSDGFYGNNERRITFDGAAREGDHTYPILIGGHNWGGRNKGHWTGVRGYDPSRDVLLLANPAGTSATFGGQEMTRAQFDDRGPFSMVRVLHPDIDGSKPAPAAPPAPAPRATDAKAALRERFAAIERDLAALKREVLGE
jgi:hypothetical protein